MRIKVNTMIRSRHRGGFGLFLLAIQLLQFFQLLSQQNELPVATIGVLAVNILAFFSEYGWHTEQTCISAWHVLYGKQWSRLLLASYFHADDYHLYYNMASFMWKALTLERHFGSGYLIYMIAVFSVASNAVYVAVSVVMARLTEDSSYISTCAVGFSGVIFALKVVTTHIQPYGTASLMGFITVPVKLAVWLELVLISVLFPNVSFVGHLAGILVGVAYVRGPLKTLMDLPFTGVHLPIFGLGRSGSYTYAARPTGYNTQRTRISSSSRNGSTSRGHHQDNTNDDADLQEAIARSLRNTNGQSSDLQMAPEYHHPGTHERHTGSRDLSGESSTMAPPRVSDQERRSQSLSTEQLRVARLQHMGLIPH